MTLEIEQVTAKVSEEIRLLHKVRDKVAHVIIGQEDLVDRLIAALMCNQHVLIEGVPGLAKTLTVTTLAGTIDVDF